MCIALKLLPKAHRRWFYVGSASTTSHQRWTNVGLFYLVIIGSRDSFIYMTVVDTYMCMQDGVQTRQTRDVHPMFVQCWSTVCDAGPTLNQNWFNFSFLQCRACIMYTSFNMFKDTCPVCSFDVAALRSNLYVTCVNDLCLPQDQDTGLYAARISSIWSAEGMSRGDESTADHGDSKGFTISIESIPANTSTWPNAVSMLAHRLRRWPNIETTLGQVLVFAGMLQVYYNPFVVSLLSPCSAAASVDKIQFYFFVRFCFELLDWCMTVLGKQSFFFNSQNTCSKYFQKLFCPWK